MTSNAGSNSQAPLPLERFAEISAELDSGEPRDQVLARAGLTVDQWLNAQHYWLSAMGAEAMRTRYELAHTYSALFQEARRAITKRKAKKRQTLPADITNAPESRQLMGEVVAKQQEAAKPLMQGLGAAVEHGPRLTLAQWAALCAEIAVYAANADAIRDRYGFDGAAFDRERAQWENRFASDRAVFDEYLMRFRHYRDWFLGANAR